MRAVRDTRYKLICNFEPGIGLQIDANVLQAPDGDAMRETPCDWPRSKIEFYDLAQDPWERNNLAGNPDTLEIESALTRELYNGFSRTGVPLVGLPLAGCR